MIKLSVLHTLAIVEINRFASELRTINNRITAPYPPMTGEEQKEHDVFFKSLPFKQTELIKQIEKWSQALYLDVTKNYTYEEQSLLLKPSKNGRKLE